MASVSTPIRIFDEIAELIASGPDRETLLEFRPSIETQERAGELLARLKNETLTEEEREELDDFVRAESFVQLVKARLRRRADG